MGKMFCKDCGKICERKSKFAQYCDDCKEKRRAKGNDKMKKTYQKKAFFQLTYELNKAKNGKVKQ
jgi:hypothetical protein